MEDRRIDIEVDGVKFISHGHYYDGINKWLCHKLKENDEQAIDYCARQLAKIIPDNAVVIPIPGHHGYAYQTLHLARAISVHTRGKVTVANILRGADRESNYQSKKNGHPLSAAQMRFFLVGSLPKDRTLYLLDNCVDSGETAKAAYNAIGKKSIVVSYAMSETFLQNQKQTTLKR